MRKCLSGLAILICAAAPIWAHHGSTGYDQKKPVHLVGTVSGLDWSNPHIVVHVDAPGADGKMATWLVNTRPPNTAIREGFSKADFAVGTAVTIDGYQASDGSNRVNGTNILLKDGKGIKSAPCFDDEPYCYKPWAGSAIPK